MTGTLDSIGAVIFAGIGATVFLDLFSLARARLLNEPVINWAMFGRWLGHMRAGRFVHDNIAAAAPVAYERALGWGFHYLVGVGLAAGLWLVAGSAWFDAPRFWPAFVYGVVTVILPMLTTQPGLGMGLAASRLPNPWAARWRSAMTHGVFGLGLFLAALIWRAILS